MGGYIGLRAGSPCQERLNNLYCLEPALIERSSVGAGSDTYFVTCADGKYVVKFPALSEINHPGAEPELCEYLNCQGIPCCHFLRNNTGNFLSTDANGRLFHVQKFIEGRLYGLNEAPDWLLIQSAQTIRSPCVIIMGSITRLQRQTAIYISIRLYFLQNYSDG